MDFLRRQLQRLIERIGGRPRAEVLGTLACILALDSADKGAVGAMAGELEHAFGIGYTDIGLLLTVSLLLGALGTIPFGWAVDRMSRIPLLTWVVVTWGVAMILGASAISYEYLLGTRVLLAGVTAAAMPAVASLVGDYFDPKERGAMYGYILSGELIGTGVGFILAGELATWSWRAGFVALGIPAFGLAWLIHRLPEPARGGADRLERGQESFDPSRRTRAGGGSGDEDMERKVQLAARRRAIPPREELLLDDEPRAKSLWWAVRYVLRIPTNLVLISVSALAYYFFAGVRVFGVQYLESWFRLSHPVATALIVVIGAGGLIGVLLGGRVADLLLRHGWLTGRVLVAAVAYLATVAFFLWGTLATALWTGIAALFLAALFLGAVNPALDAGRLDIMHPQLWGRAESVRVFLRKLAEAIAPVAFGLVAGHIFGGSNTSREGLHKAFLVMLGPYSLGALIAFVAVKTYPRDVATADENTRRTNAIREQKAA